MKENLKDYEEETFYPYLRNLVSIKNALKRYSLLILLLLLISYVGTFAFALLHSYNAQRDSFYRHNFYTGLETPLITLLITFVVYGILLLFRFNSIREKGMILYEEITDEIDWSRKRKEFMHKPPIELRIVIKEFLKSTDLPFTSGKNGQALYVILFLTIILVVTLIQTILI